LLELLIAVVMVSVVVTAISLLLPKASSTITVSRQRMLASNFATTRIQELKEEPYALIAITPAATTGNFPVSGIGNPGGCDCKKDLASMPVDATYTEDGVTYTRQICVQLADRAGVNWKTYCPDSPLTPATDHGLKNIRVRVSWPSGSTTSFYDTETQVSR